MRFIERQLYLDLAEHRYDRGLIISRVTASLRSKTDRSVKSAGIHINKSQCFCGIARDGGFSRTRGAVNSNCSSHNRTPLIVTFYYILYFAAEVPANLPVEYAICRLNPPVYASRSRTSPAK